MSEHGRDVLTALDVVLRLEKKVDMVLDDHEDRLRALERSGFRLSGAWATIGLVCATLAGAAGLVLGAASLLVAG